MSRAVSPTPATTPPMSVNSAIGNRQSATPTHTHVRRRKGLDVSVTGLIFAAMMLFMGVAAVNSQANLLFGVFGLMIGLLIVSSVISRLVLRRLEVRRVLPDHGVVGRLMPVT